MDEVPEPIHVEKGPPGPGPANDPYLVWWRTAKDRDPEIKATDDYMAGGRVIQHYRYLQPLHARCGHQCTGLHFNTKKDAPPATGPGYICSGMTAKRPKSKLRTVECRMATCPACWHRRQSDIGRLIHGIDAPYWYVAWTSLFSTEKPIPEKVVKRLRGDAHRFNLVAWVVVATVQTHSTGVVGEDVFQRLVLVSTSDKLIESNRPEMVENGVVIGSVDRKRFTSRAAAYTQWLDLNPHPGSVLTRDDGSMQALLIERHNLKKSVIGRGLV